MAFSPYKCITFILSYTSNFDFVDVLMVVNYIYYLPDKHTKQIQRESTHLC